MQLLQQAAIKNHIKTPPNFHLLPYHRTTTKSTCLANTVRFPDTYRTSRKGNMQVPRVEASLDTGCSGYCLRPVLTGGFICPPAPG